MNTNNGALSFRALLDTSHFDAGELRLESKLKQLSSLADQEASKFDSIFKRLGTATAAYFSLNTGAQMISNIVKVRNEFQQLEIAFTTMLKSKAKGDALLAEVANIAATTPFGLKDVASGTKMLLAYGTELGNVREEIMMLGNVASGTGQPLNDLIYLYGTLRTQGRAYAMDIRQFAGRGIPIYTELAKVMGINKDQVAAFVEEGKVGFPEVEKAFKNMTKDGIGMFAGLMEAQSKSIGGNLERLGDAWDLMLNKIGKSNQDSINDVIALGAAAIENYEQIGKILAGLIATYGTYKASVMAVSAMKSFEASTYRKVATSITAESGALAQSIALKVTNAEQTATLAASIAAETAARAANAKAAENQMRVEFGALAIKEAEALEAAKLTAATIAEAEAKVAAAIAAEVAAQKRLGSSAKETAAKNVEIAQNELLVASEAHLAATKAAASVSADVSTKKYLLDTAAKEANAAANLANASSNAAATAAANANTVANTRLSLATIFQTRMQSLLNRVISANPYVLLATAVIGTTAAVWALHDGTSAQEQAQKRLNKLIEESKKHYEELKSEINGYIQVIQSETASTYDKITAYENLKRVAPEITNQYNMMSLAALNNADAQRKVATIMNDIQYNDLIKQSQDAQKKVTDLANTIKNIPVDNQTAAYLKNANEELEKAKAFADEITNKIAQENSLRKEAAELERINNLPIEERIKHYKNVEQALSTQKSALEITLFMANKTGQAFDQWKTSIQTFTLQGVISQLADVQGIIAGLSGTGGSTLTGKAFWEDQKKRSQEDLDKMSGRSENPAQWDKLTGSIRQADKALEQWNVTVTKTKSKKKEEIFPAGSVAEFDRQLKKVQETLSKLNPETQSDKVKEFQDLFLELTRQRAEANKLIEVKTWEETLEQKRKMYEEYESVVNSGSFYKKDFVDELSAKLIAGGKSYKEFLENEIAPLRAKMLDESISTDEFSKLVTLTKELNTVMGISSPMEKFNDMLEGIKNNASNTADYLDKLEKGLESLMAKPEDERNTLWASKVKATKDAIKAGNQEAAKELKSFLEEVKTSEEKRLAIVNKYASLRKQAEKEGKSTAIIDKQEQQELSEFMYQASAEFKAMNETMVGTGRIQLENYVILVEKNLAKVRDLFGENSAEYREALKEVKTAKDSLSDFDAQQWSMWAGVVGNAADEFKDMEGTIGNIASLFSAVAANAGRFASAYNSIQKNGGKNTSESYAAAASGALDLIGLVVNAAKKRKAKKEDERYNTLQVQLDLNKALIEEIRLRTELSENVYVTNYYGRITDSIDAMAVATSKAMDELMKLDEIGKAKNGTKNKIDWGAVGAGAGSGATIGAAAGAPVFGVGAAIGAVVGGIVGGLIGLFGAMKKDSRYSGLFELYPELISQSGEFNATLAQTLIANDQLTAETKQHLQALIDINEEWKKAKEQITAVVEELTGSLGNDLRDALVTAFEDGTSAGEAFANSVTKTLENALQNLIYSAVFSQVFDQLQNMLEGSLMGSGQSFQEVFAWFMEQSDELNTQFQEAMKAAQEAGKDFGFDLWDNKDAEKRAQGLTGQIQGVSEETASLIAGQLNAIRIRQAETGEDVRMQLFYLANISRNTEYLQMLVSIDRSIRQLSNSNDSRSFGVV